MLISKWFGFEASHVLPRHLGKCSRLHGHSYKVGVSISGPIDDDSQFILDYGRMKDIVQPIIDTLDHRHLNSFIRYPSAENIAIFIGAYLKQQMPERITRIVVQVRETENTEAVWDSDRIEDQALLALPDSNTQWLPPVMPEDLPGEDMELQAEADTRYTNAMNLFRTVEAELAIVEACRLKRGK